MAQYVSRFIPNYSTIVTPLRELTKTETKWQWGAEEQASLDGLKEALCNSPVFKYFEPRLLTTLLVDAIPFALGAVLMQDEHVIAYASRALLSDVESRYSQTEREMLAVVWAADHFKLYVYGAKFSIVTDHKPLLGLFSSQKQTSPRIDRWKLRLTPYDYVLHYRPGKNDENPADYLSRHPGSQDYSKNVAEEYVSYVVGNAVPKAMTLEEIRKETQEDIQMQALIRAIMLNSWDDPNISEYSRSRDIHEELSVAAGVVLRRNRIVIPTKLQDKAISLGHIGHKGVVKTKSLMREKVWFPNMGRMVETAIKECITCQAANPGGTSAEPLHMSPLPAAPWTEVSVDFAGPFPNGDYLLVVVDDYSRYPEVEIVGTTSAKSTIPRLDAIFARQGIPKQV